MDTTKVPTHANGKICYMEIPAINIEHSAAFYQKVFGWNIRKRSDGVTAFDDTIGEVSGTWSLCREIVKEPGLLVYIMVDSVSQTCEDIVTNGGNIVQPVGMNTHEITARFADPAGNVFGLYQEPVTA